MLSEAVTHPLKSKAAAPQQFTFPHCYTPHPLVVEASEAVKAELKRHPEWADEIGEGKMFGVLVVESRTPNKAAEPTNPEAETTEQAANGLAFLAAFSGTLGGRTVQPYFVEPVFDLMGEGSYFKQEEAAISLLAKGDGNSEGEADSKLREEQRAEAKQRSIALQRWLFAQYGFLNANGETAGMERLFESTTPPSGTGDCCAPKLLQAAYRRGLKPLCMGEFWMGRSPRGEVREEGRFYPACSAKCKPLLRHMLQGLDVEPNPLLRQISAPLKTLYEDTDIVVVAKPSGMLAVPGKDALPNVHDEIRARYPQATGPLIVHRLDMDTSGLMVLALNEDAYHNLQEQFTKHQVEKRYTALLEREMPVGTEGRIDLPLCPDITDRPRQMVHEQYGRRSITVYKVVGNSNGHAVIHLWPHTGRTHQLRVHCAHQRSLGNPILGDRLYGTVGQRLMLHAAELSFTHPTSGERLHFTVEIEEAG